MTTMNQTTIYINEVVEGELISNGYIPTLLKNVKKNDFFTVKAGAKNKYVKGEYNREFKTWFCTAWINGNDKELKSNKVVYIGFSY